MYEKSAQHEANRKSNDNEGKQEALDEVDKANERLKAEKKLEPTPEGEES